VTPRLTQQVGDDQDQPPSARIDQLDAEATAGNVARTDLLLPVFAPRVDRWLDVAVVVDTSPSMAVSGQTIRELATILAETGAFRDVRTWRCDSDDPDAHRMSLRAEPSHAGVSHDPAELVDPSGRRLILVVSDLLGQAWRDRRMASALEIWAKAGPVAVVQPLPQRLWDSCGVPVHPVVLSSLAPAAPNIDLTVRVPSAELDLDSAGTDSPRGIVVPVIELGHEWFAAWARLVTEGSGDERPGRAIFTGLLEPSWTGDHTVVPEAEPAPSVEEFLATAPPDTVRLAAFLSAAAPLTLPVMRLIQRANLPSSGPTALPELFLSGLLELAAPADDPEESVYDFAPDMRKELLTLITRQEALGVLQEVSSYLVARLGTNLDFLALLSTGEPVSELDEGGRAFAAVAVDVLEALGGTYGRMAERLRAALDQGTTAEASYPVPDPVLTSAVAPVSVPARPEQYTPLGWKTVPPLNPNFVGRADLLDAMRAQLVNSSQTAVLLPRALYGLGGVGKTQLAIEYVHRHAAEYDLVWWVAADDPAETRRSLVELAGQLGIAVTGDTGGTISRVHEALTRRKPYSHWLMVFDNAGEARAMSGLLPSARSGHVLVTTREIEWADRARALEVDRFARAESVALLTRYGGLAPGDADHIADRLGDLPISLAQAAAWHHQTRRPAADYLRLLEQQLELHDGDAFLGYPPHAGAAMRIAAEQLRSESEQSALLLQLATFFGPEWISYDILHRGRLATPFSRDLGRILRDLAPLERAVKEIARWELVRNDSRNLRFQIHRLVRKMVQDAMAPGLRDTLRETVQTMLAYANPGNPDRVRREDWEKHAELSGHITASGVIESENDEARQVVIDQIRYRYLVGDFESSLDLATEALDVWEPRFGPLDEFTLITRRHRANVLAALGRPAEALEIDRAVLEGFTASYGPDHEHTMASVNSVSADLRALGSFAEARRLVEDNYERHVYVFGTEDSATISTAGSLGDDLRMAGEYQAALEIDQRTFDVAVRVFGRNDRRALLLSRNMAADLYALGRYGDAYRMQSEVLPASEQTLGADHPDVLLARRLVVVSLRKLGRLTEAADEAGTVLHAFRDRLGDKHPHTLLTLQTVTNALRDDGQLVEAVRAGEEALGRYRSDMPDHPLTLVCLTNLAIVYRQTGLMAEARRFNQEALDGLTAIFGPDHPYTLSCATNMANDLAAQGDLDGALRLSEETLERSLRARGRAQPYTVACAVNHALGLIAAKVPTGPALLRETVRLMEDLPDFGPAHPEVVLALDGKRIDSDIEAPPT
ncbi:FxSxx-COOH system tetratricopeptide repeat protein, partial [Actinoplanes sp. NPDC026623]|uniref:FxSxx-COOH system tetratricopeptide repeat protein n=1 Tax=Actinoplanes sp. NPDC026623 TaxID=3155610 RepID=UPI0033DC0A5F